MRLLALVLEERTLAILVLAGGIFIGLAQPVIADTLRPWALPALLFVVIFSLIPFARLPLGSILRVDRPTVRIVFWQLVVLPCIIIACAVLARIPDSWVFLAIVTACSGSLFSAPALAELLQLDSRRVLQVMVLSTLFMPFSLFAFIDIYGGLKAIIELEAYLERTMVFMVLPFALMMAIRPLILQLSPAANLKLDFAARWATIIALLIFGTGLMSAVSDEIPRNPTKVLLMLVLATALCVSLMALTVVVMHKFGEREAMTAAIATGFRNVGLGFALVGDTLGEDLATYAGVSLLPIFLAPLMLRFLFSPQLVTAKA